MNSLEIFNEACILLIAYQLFMFTSYVANIKTQYQGGWSVISFTTLNIIANMGVLVFQTLKQAVVVLRSLIAKLKQYFANRRKDYDLPEG